MRGSHLLLILLVAAVAGQEVPAPEKAGISSASEADRAARIARRQQQLAAQQAAAAAPSTSLAVPGAGPQALSTTPPTGPAAAAPGDPAAAAAAAAGPGAVAAAPVIPPGAPPAAPSPAAAAAAAASPVTPPANPAAAAATAGTQPQPGAAPEAGPAEAAATGPATVPGTLPSGQPAVPAAAAAAAGADAVASPSPRPRRRRRSPAPRRQLDVSPSPAVTAPGAASAQPPGALPGAANATDTAPAPPAAAAAPGNATVPPGSSPSPSADSVNGTGPGVGANGTEAGNRTGDAGGSPAPGEKLDGAESPGVSISPSPGFNPPPPAGSNSNAGAIIGGILGTLAALTLLAGIAALIAWCRRRRLRKNNPFSDTGPKKQQQQHPHHRPAWLDKLPGFGKKNPQDGVTVYKNPVYAPKGPPGPCPGPGPYVNGRAGPGGPGGPGPYANGRAGPGGPGPYANGTPSYNRSLSDPGGSGGHFYGYPPQGSTGGSGSRGNPVPPAAYGPPAVVSGGPGRGAAAFGYGADELQDCLKDLKYVVTNRLLPAVDSASLITDPVAAWIDAGMAEVRPELSNAAYGASHTFVEDWRTHRVWDWLNSSHWKFIPSDERLLDAQVNPTLPQRDFARQMLSMIKRDPRFPPFVAAVDDAVDTLLEDAVSVARTVGVLSTSNNDSSSYRSRDQGPVPAAAQAAANYYRPVLTQLFEAALRLHLQVQGTNSTAYIFVPGAPPAVSLAIPERGLVRKDRLGGTAAELHYLCEQPGVFSEDARATTGVEVWVPAHAIRVGLRPSY